MATTKPTAHPGPAPSCTHDLLEVLSTNGRNLDGAVRRCAFCGVDPSAPASVDLASAVSVFTGEPTDKALHAHAPQVGAPAYVLGDPIPAGPCSMPGCGAACPEGCGYFRHGQRLCRGCYRDGLSGSGDDGDTEGADEREDREFSTAMRNEHGRWY